MWGVYTGRYSGRLVDALEDVYPEFDWVAWEFAKIPQGFADLWENRKMLADWFMKEQGWGGLEDWYSCTTTVLKRSKLNSMLTRVYNSSLIDMLKDLYPDQNWLPWKFVSAPNTFWADDANVRWFFDWFEQKEGITKPEDWYNVVVKSIVEVGGRSVLYRRFGGGPRQAAMYLYPDHDWHQWKFKKLGWGFWEDESNVRDYLHWLGKELNFSKPEDWYKLTQSKLRKNYGGTLLRNSNGSIIAVCEQAFPEYDWKPWLFDKAPNGFWLELQNQRAYLDWLAIKLEISHPEGWYRYDRDVLNRNHGAGLLDQYSTSLARALVANYPDTNWDLARLLKVGKTQKQLHHFVENLLPNFEVVANFRHPLLRFSDSGHPMEIDIWISELQLGIEYQGEQHYPEAFRVGMFGGEDESKSLHKRDAEKREACAKAGILLLEFDYRWDRKKASVRKMLKEHGFPV